MKSKNYIISLLFSLGIGLVGLTYPGKTNQSITDKLGLTSVRVNSIITPSSVKELQTIVTKTTLPISIAGACYSQGGQTGYPGGIVIDMKQLNNIVAFDEKQKTITVQAGATWYDVQRHIDPYNLSVKAMQSYNSFSIGGSLSINAHGRDIAYGSVINGIQSIEILLADGTIVVADRHNNSDLFRAAIGGYGLLGIITQATIELTENIPLERKVYQCNVDNFKSLFESVIAQDKSVVFYNTDVFPKRYQECLITTWNKTTQSVTDEIRLQEQNSPFYIVNKALEMFLRRVPLAQFSRLPIEHITKIKAPARVVWRNNEMSYSVNQLALDFHFPSTMTLQEYFIPVEHAQKFVKKLSKILQKNWVNVLNVSIRYVPADTTSTMSYARQDSFAFVLYLNIFNNRWTIDSSCKWTQKIIDAVLQYNGTCYLPYLIHATPQQFQKAYPHFDDLLKIKQIYDPHNKFRNMLLQKYT
jgi:FAD/FMN-containing dehydrogenase